jgi:hypothetical protein
MRTRLATFHYFADTFGTLKHASSIDISDRLHEYLKWIFFFEMSMIKSCDPYPDLLGFAATKPTMTRDLSLKKG